MSIYKDDEGRWHGYVSMGLKDNGRRDRRHVSGERRADVQAKVRELERHRDEGAGAAAGRQATVTAWLEHWLDTIAAPKVRPSTLQRYRQLVKFQLAPKVGHHRLDRLQPEHVERMYAELLASGLSPASVLQAHRVLSRSLKVAMQRGRIARNVCTLVDAPSVHRQEVQPLTADEARRVLRTAADMRNGARWSVALALGLRQGEALGLPWDAIDLDSGTLRVRQALQRLPGAGLVMVEPKSTAGKRDHQVARAAGKRVASAPRSTEGGAHRGRERLGRPRPGLLSGQRTTYRPQRGPPRLAFPSRCRRSSASPAARRTAHRGDRHADPRRRRLASPCRCSATHRSA